jgi:hypothetical protein
MSFLTNGPACQGQGPHRGRIHESEAQMIAEADGTPVKDAPKEKAYFCEACFPDSDDPNYLTCTCRLCLERRAKTRSN